MSPVEFWLPIGAAAFYLYDAVLMLWQNELVYTRTRGAWLVDGGSQIRLGARRLFLPNPLLPQRPQFLVRWTGNDPRAAEAEAEIPGTLLRALRPIGVLNFAQMVLLIALPIALWADGAGLAALAVFALFYVLSIVALVFMFRRRVALGLSTRQCWLQALDAIACAPFAVNLTRRIALLHGLNGEPLRFAARHFDAPTLAQARELVAARIHEELADPDATAQREQKLATVLARLGT
jgi:hypothetical protein